MRISVRIDSKAAQAQLRRWGGEFREKVQKVVARGIASEAAELKQDTRLVQLLRQAAEISSDDAGWATLAAVGSHIAKQSPEFDARNYGYKKLKDLVEATQLFDVEMRQVGNGPAKTTHIRDKRRKGSPAP